MDKKIIGIAVILGLVAWGLSKKKASAAQSVPPGSGDGGVIPINDLTMAIVKVQQGSSGQVIDSAGKVVISAPVANAISTGSSALDAGQAYLGHQISGITEEDYRIWAERVKGMSLHEIYTQGMTTGIPGGIVPLEISAFLEYKTQGYSANFQALISPELVARLDPVWDAEEAANETWLTPQVLLANPWLKDEYPVQSGTTVATQVPQETINYAQLQAQELERARLAAIAEAERQAETARIATAQAEAARTAAEKAEAERQAEAARQAAAAAAAQAAQAGQTTYLTTLTPEQLAQMMAGGWFGY